LRVRDVGKVSRKRGATWEGRSMGRSGGYGPRGCGGFTIAACARRPGAASRECPSTSSTPGGASCRRAPPPNRRRWSAGQRPAQPGGPVRHPEPPPGGPTPRGRGLRVTATRPPRWRALVRSPESRVLPARRFGRLTRPRRAMSCARQRTHGGPRILAWRTRRQTSTQGQGSYPWNCCRPVGWSLFCPMACWSASPLSRAMPFARPSRRRPDAPTRPQPKAAAGDPNRVAVTDFSPGSR
jgi:hypothetical protein